MAVTPEKLLPLIVTLVPPPVVPEVVPRLVTVGVEELTLTTVRVTLLEL